MRDIGALTQAAVQWLTTIVGALLTALSVIAIYFTTLLIRTAHKRGELAPKPEAIGLGAVTNFFDTLGIGSFAPSTAWMKIRKMAPDSYFPAILNAGHALPTVVQALVFITLVQVDPMLLLSCIIASVAGAFVGAPIVQRSPIRLVQAIVGLALLIAATLFALSNLNLMPGGGEALTLPPVLFGVAVGAHFIMGVLMMFGIGLYAPSLVTLSLLGLNPAAAFPIMMGSCAFLMPISSTRFIKSDRIDLRIVIGMAIGGIPAVLLAAFVVKSLDLVTLRWLVVVVVLYASALLLNGAVRGDKALSARASAWLLTVAGVAGLALSYLLRPPGNIGEAMIMMAQGREFSLGEPLYVAALAVSGLLVLGGVVGLVRAK